MTKLSDVSAKLRQVRQQAIQERKVREALWTPPGRFRARKRGPEPPPPPIVPPEAVSGRLTRVDTASGGRRLAPVCCRRPRGGWGGASSHAVCPSGMPAALHAAYATWQEHHGQCQTCSAEDWYMPGGVRAVKDALLADGQVLVKGKLVYFRRTYDLAVLCHDGRVLFQQWCAQAVRHQTVQPKKESAE